MGNQQPIYQKSITKFSIKDFKNGWLIGDFEPSILKTANFELGIHTHKAGVVGDKHYHKLSNEYNYIVSGRMLVNGVELEAGDVFVYKPYEVSDCRFIEDTVLVVTRDASNKQDKYAL
ncbi:MAG: hypothetical protein EBU90_16800 [Proteobacteria bacterium]|nr:hypothetical protein [Pseudomonadota bacterium]